MKIRSSDFLLVQLAGNAAPLLQGFGQLESRCLRRRLESIPIDKPVFITGLARSGTTMLLELMAKLPGVATHRYRDFPFLMLPYVWNRFLNRFAAAQQAVERPHQDRILITADSPEAFEEPIWHEFFPSLHSPNALHRLGAERRHEDFEAFFKDHLRKILLIRQGQRYVSKGNYNLTRLEYLGMIFPDARFVIPIRHPLTHVHSLVRQHELFEKYTREDARVPQYLAAAGHFEFGPQRRPIRLTPGTGERIEALWKEGNEYAAYALQWAEVYRWVDTLKSRNDELAQRILVIPYERFCADPFAEFTRILEHAGLPATIDRDFVEHVSESARPLQLAEEVRDTVWRETEETARRFGYGTPDPAG